MPSDWRNGERSKTSGEKQGRYSVRAACGSPDAAYELLYARSQIEILDEGISILTDADAYDEQMGLLAEDIMPVTYRFYTAKMGSRSCPIFVS